MMPMGKYANFAECQKSVSAKHKNWSSDRVKRYCGAVYQATEGQRKKHMKKELDNWDKEMNSIREEFSDLYKNEISEEMEKELESLMSGDSNLTRDEAISILINRMYKAMDNIRPVM